MKVPLERLSEIDRRLIELDVANVLLKVKSWGLEPHEIILGRIELELGRILVPLVRGQLESYSSHYVVLCLPLQAVVEV